MLSKNQIKFIRSLQQKKQRDLHKRFVVEGRRSVTELLESHSDYLDLLVVTTTYLDQNNVSKSVPFEITDEITFSKLTKSITPQGILAVFKQPELHYSEQSFMLFLDGIQDPGNMGTIIRLADWFGVKQVVCSNDCVELFNPKVVQSSMGAVFRVPVVYHPLEDLLTRTSLPVYGALLEGESVYQQPLDFHGILVMGNEGNGISPAVFPYITKPVLIPRFGGGESLNVSTATGILLSEFRRNS